jgi:ribosomal protein S18 acetylase RimI-like enzyme
MIRSFRAATADDAGSIAALHADSWRRHYRGAYADSFLDGDVLADRREVWTSRLTEPAGRTVTILAEDQGALTGFVHVVLDDDPVWGSLVDNLHVTNALRGRGIGAALMARAARSVLGGAARSRMYLWVLQQNEAAQGFYGSVGGVAAGSGVVGGPGGAHRLVGTPGKFRYAWHEEAVTALASRP